MPPSRLAAGVLAAAVLAPAPAAAQHEAFVEAVMAFHAALTGTYGDEGAAALAALDRMASSLDAWEAALRRAEAELQASPTTSPAELALLYADQGRSADAIRAMDAAISAEPTRTSLYAYQGLLQEASGRPVDAARTFAAAVTRDPTDPVVAYLAASRPSPASSGGDLQPLIATLIAAERRPQRYLAVFAQFNLIDDRPAPGPLFSPASYEEGMALLTRGRYREALTQFRTALAADPLATSPAGRHADALAGAMAMREQRGAIAVDRFEAAVAALPQSSEARRLLGAAFRAIDRLPESIRTLEAAMALAPGDERVRVTLGSTLADAGRLSDAERLLRETVTALPSSGLARWALADVYERQHRSRDAIAVLEEAASLAMVAGKTLIYERIALLAHRHSDQDQITTALTRRARLVPNEPFVHRDLGLHYAKLGRHDEALIELLMTVLLGGEDSRMLTAIGQAHVAAGRLDDAERALRRAVAADATNAQAQYSLGTTLIRLDRGPEGRQHLDEYRRLSASKLNQHQRLLGQDAGADGLLP